MKENLSKAVLAVMEKWLRFEIEPREDLQAVQLVMSIGDPHPTLEDISINQRALITRELITISKVDPIYLGTEKIFEGLISSAMHEVTIMHHLRLSFWKRLKFLFLRRIK